MAHVLAIVKEWNNPWISLRYNHTVDIEEFSKFSDWQICSNRSIQEFLSFLDVFLDFSGIILTVQISSSVN